jgi:Cyclic nucleotide-binding domain
MRVESAATALSWIPSEAVTGLTRSAFTVGFAHYDQPPAGTLGDLGELRAADRFRFANRLAVWAEFDGGTLVAYGQDGGGLMGSTTVRIAALGTTFAAVGMPDLRPQPEVGPGWVRFSQTCGGRTAIPAPRRITRPPFVRLRAPLVWTTLTITLYADGRSEVGLAGASPFPRHWVYGPDGALTLKAGMTDFAGWMSQPSSRFTPWGDEDSPVVVTAAETALERELSGLLMRGATKPRIRVLGAGEVLAAQGAPGDSLYLLLDGVLRVDVDGQPLAEIGPGAVLGERAVLAGGTRTATLTAVTPIRVAEAPASALDPAALAELSQGHRREATAGAAAAPVER